MTLGYRIGDWWLNDTGFWRCLRNDADAAIWVRWYGWASPDPVPNPLKAPPGKAADCAVPLGINRRNDHHYDCPGAVVRVDRTVMGSN
jgi:hypothetical protein